MVHCDALTDKCNDGLFGRDAIVLMCNDDPSDRVDDSFNNGHKRKI